MRRCGEYFAGSIPANGLPGTLLDEAVSAARERGSKVLDKRWTLARRACARIAI